MARKNEKLESVSIGQLTKFRDYWRESSEYPEENRGNDRVYYPVSVVYEWKDCTKSDDFVTDFVAFIGSGPDDGKIDLTEVGSATTSKFHLTFLPSFQSYKFDKVTGAITVSGNSDKMKGGYRVTISPRITHP